MSSRATTGWVYVLSNESHVGMVKIGFSAGRPEHRAREMNGTNSPTPFEVATAFLFEDHVYDIEQAVHERLAGCRVSPNREFFRCSPLEAAHVIVEIAKSFDLGPLKVLNDLLEGEVERKRREEDAKCGEDDQVDHLEKYVQGLHQRIAEKKRREEEYEERCRIADEEEERRLAAESDKSLKDEEEYEDEEYEEKEGLREEPMPDFLSEDKEEESQPIDLEVGEQWFNSELRTHPPREGTPGLTFNPFSKRFEWRDEDETH